MIVQSRFVAAAASLLLLAGNASAQSVDFTAKTVRIVVGFGTGSGYDQYGRLLGMHIGKHLPGKPTVVVENMPGAGSIKAANFIYEVAPKDGTVFAILARDSIAQPLINPEGIRYDGTKFSWLGSPVIETNVCVAMAAAGAKTWQDLQQKQLIMGSTGAGTGTHVFPHVMNGVLGTRFKVIDGYQASADVLLAMERREVDGICESYSSVMRKDAKAIAEGKVLILLQAGHKPNAELPKVPFVPDLAKTPEDRSLLEFLYAGQAFARPFVAPPGLSPALHQALRKGYEAALKDPELLADAERQKLEISPVDADEALALVRKMYATPKPVLARVAELMKAR